MSKFKKFTQKIKDNKYKIIIGTITITGVVFVIVKQNGKINQLLIANEEQSDQIKDLRLTNVQQQKDIDVLKHVMNGTVLTSLKSSTKRQLRYAEGRLNNGLKSGTITEADEKLRRDEMEYFTKELEMIFEAEKLLVKGD